MFFLCQCLCSSWLKLKFQVLFKCLFTLLRVFICVLWCCLLFCLNKRLLVLLVVVVIGSSNSRKTIVPGGHISLWPGDIFCGCIMLRADVKHMAGVRKLPHFLSPNFCWFCPANKTDRPWLHFTSSSRWSIEFYTSLSWAHFVPMNNMLRLH